MITVSLSCSWVLGSVFEVLSGFVFLIAPAFSVVDIQSSVYYDAFCDPFLGLGVCVSSSFIMTFPCLIWVMYIFASCASSVAQVCSRCPDSLLCKYCSSLPMFFSCHCFTFPPCCVLCVCVSLLQQNVGFKFKFMFRFPSFPGPHSACNAALSIS